MVIVDGNALHLMLGKGDVDVQACQRGVASKAGQILRNNDGYLIALHRLQHLLKPGPLETRTGVSVVHEKDEIHEVAVLGVPLQDCLMATRRQPQDMGEVYSKDLWTHQVLQDPVEKLFCQTHGKSPLTNVV